MNNDIPISEKQKCYDPELKGHCSGCTDPRSEGTHQFCTAEHGHYGCEFDPTKKPLIEKPAEKCCEKCASILLISKARFGVGFCPCPCHIWTKILAKEEEKHTSAPKEESSMGWIELEALLMHYREGRATDDDFKDFFRAELARQRKEAIDEIAEWAKKNAVDDGPSPVILLSDLLTTLGMREDPPTRHE